MIEQFIQSDARTLNDNYKGMLRKKHTAARISSTPRSNAQSLPLGNSTVLRHLSSTSRGDSKNSMPILGIDLGTTNSCLAHVDSNGYPSVIPTKDGNRTMPSVVSLREREDGSTDTLVGAEAVDHGIIHSGDVISSTKRLIGRKYDDEITKKCQSQVPYKIVRGPNGDAWVTTGKPGRKVMSPSEVGGLVLGKIKKSASHFFSAGDSGMEKGDFKAVITVPAYFNDSQRQATKDAGKISGLDVVRIINEPTAAALAYGIEKKEGKTLAVFDLGGGTFDISILQVSRDVFEVRSTNGDTFLGGEDFDMLLLKHFVERFKKETGIDITKNRDSFNKLKTAVEKMKVELSSVPTAEIRVPRIAKNSGDKDLNLHFEMTRKELESLVSPLVERTLKPCRKALEDAGMKSADVDEVILVGGATRMPLVVEEVTSFFKRSPAQDTNPDEVVALGAAIQGGVLNGKVDDILLLDVTPLSLGIETLGGVFTRLIDRNTSIPTTRTQVFSTAEDNQLYVKIKVLQGEREMAAKNELLGEFVLSDIPPAPLGVPQIEVTFDIDANGIVNVTARDRATKKEHKLTVQSSGGLSEEDIQRIVREAAAKSHEDTAARKVVELKNEARALVSTARSALAVHRKKIPISLVNDLEKEISNLDRISSDGAASQNHEIFERELRLYSTNVKDIMMKIYGKIAQTAKN